MKTHTFSRRVNLPVSAARAYEWHERPMAFERILPPWEEVQVVTKAGGIRDGKHVELLSKIGPFTATWLVEYRDCRPGDQFRDVALRSPFAYWNHLHRFEPQSENLCTLEDSIEFVLPGGSIGQLLINGYTQHQLERMFRYRHETTASDLALQEQYKDRGMRKIAVTGGSGLIGHALIPFLSTAGHEVFSWRRQNAASYFFEQLDFPADAVVHLAGENIGERWTPAKKAKILESRVEGTRSLCRQLAELPTPPKVLICASATGYYGFRGEEILDEKSTLGQGFLAEVVERWEAAAEPARERGIRVVMLRFGVILSPRGGALKSMEGPYRFGFGGRIGDGKQYWSWISVDDAIGAILHAIHTESLEGPVNVVTPHPVTNAEFSACLGRVLHRPAIAPFPAIAVRMLLGELGEELLLSSKRVVPAKLIAAGYQFRYPDLENALKHLLGK
jgi:uncharacterized protein (TIGR01777 family)